MVKWICLAFLFIGKYGESYHQARNCPPINNSSHHTDNIIENIALTLTTVPNLAAAVPENLRKWPKGKELDGKYEVPYAFHKSLPSKTKQAVYFGMVVVERGTNIIFIKKRKNDTNYIFFEEPTKDVCESSVGKQKKLQFIRLAPRCRRPADVIHELLHTLGLMHEHQRIDRSVSNDTWGNGTNNAPNPSIKAVTPYDPFSIMHYPLPSGASLRVEDNWTETDTLEARMSRAFPSICDYSGINQIYKGHVKSPPCTDVRIRPPLLEATEEGTRKWEEYLPGAGEQGYDMTWACNYQSGGRLANIEIFHYSREQRTLCQFQNNNMYPSVWWIPYAETYTYPLSGLNYSKFKTFPVKVNPNWITHDICDCLGPPPLFRSRLTPHSMYQTCLECVHFEHTTVNVLKCIAKRSGEYGEVLSHLQNTYNTTQYYLT